MLSSKELQCARGFMLVLSRHFKIHTFKLVHTGWKEDKYTETGRVLPGTNIERFWQHIQKVK